MRTVDLGYPLDIVKTQVRYLKGAGAAAVLSGEWRVHLHLVAAGAAAAAFYPGLDAHGDAAAGAQAQCQA
ncbi:MAG TPA: hypothetical protein DDW31_00215 [candidate division Zixibacteria bacterium]|nr:hypothetical protein [candidate division Zixibacteria bacterium]